MKDTAIKIVSAAYIALLALDVLTTSINGPLVKYLETNPLYKYVGVIGIVILNLGLLLLFYYAYTKLGTTARFTILMILTTICIIRGITCWNNLMVYLHPPTITEAMTVTAAQKVATVKRYAWSGILMYLPGIVTYLIFTVDHNIQVK
jgi:hypothetical protein